VAHHFSVGTHLHDQIPLDWRFTGWIELIIVSRIVLRDTNWDGGVPAGISTRDYFGSITD
jgi:hypothetical protein